MSIVHIHNLLHHQLSSVFSTNVTISLCADLPTISPSVLGVLLMLWLVASVVTFNRATASAQIHFLNNPLLY